MSTWYTSDYHFAHNSILTFQDENRRDARGARFKNVSHMDEHLIAMWNETVSPDDTVYCLGDMSFKQTVLEAVMPRLHGEKILIVGNHCPYFKRLNMPRKTKMHHEAYIDACRAGFKDISLRLDVQIDGIGEVCLSHFPYWPSDISGLPDYDLRHQENRPVVDDSKLLLCGHVHSQWKYQINKGRPPLLNVGIDAWGLKPVAEAEIVRFYNEFLKPPGAL